MLFCCFGKSTVLPLLTGCRNKKLVPGGAEVGYVLFLQLQREGLLPFTQPLFPFFFFLSPLRPPSSESHHPLSSLVEIRQEIQKYLGDAD